MAQKILRHAASVALLPVQMFGLAVPQHVAHQTIVPEQVPHLPISLLVVVTFLLMLNTATGFMYTLIRKTPFQGYERDEEGNTVPVLIGREGTGRQFGKECVAVGTALMVAVCALCLLPMILLANTPLAQHWTTKSGIISLMLANITDSQRVMWAALASATVVMALSTAFVFFRIKAPYFRLI